VKKANSKKGISMIVVLWVITILTVVVAATALMTYSDITSTINLKKRYTTLRAAEAPADFLISYLPTYKDLHELDLVFLNEDENKVFYENHNTDTVLTVPLYLSIDSSIIGCLAPPRFINFYIDSSLIVYRPSETAAGEDTLRDTLVNPIFAQDGALIQYRTRGVIEKGDDIVAYRRIQNGSAFSIPTGGAGEGGGGGFGHTMY
jgi:hypothetical protein